MNIQLPISIQAKYKLKFPHMAHLLLSSDQALTRKNFNLSDYYQIHLIIKQEEV